MSSLKKRGLILTFSRATDKAVMMFSPLLLVRILDVHDYGQYREFMLYATVLSEIISLNAGRSLLYFMPLKPDLTRRFVTQVILFSFVLTLGGCLLVVAGADLIRSYTSFDFVLPLVLYLFFMTNLNYFEFYWLARKRSDVVLYYSTGKLILRLIVVVAVAWLTHDALAIAYALVVFEAIRMLLVLIYSWRKRLLGKDVEWQSCKEQMAYFVPLGGANIIYVINENLSRLFVSTNLGTIALSLYTIGSYATPLRKVLRSSVGDVIFPEMVSKSGADDPQERLRLWQMSTLFLCLLLFPAATIMVVHADLIVTTLFTAQYADAAPLFAIYALVLAWDCFDLTLPVRSAGKTMYLVYTSAAGLIVNLALLFPLYHAFGLIGPALAYLGTRIFSGLIFMFFILRLYNIRLKDMLPWSGIARVGLGCMVTAPLLYGFNALDVHELIQAFFGMALFGIGYVIFIRLFGSRLASDMMMRMLPVLRRSPS